MSELKKRFKSLYEEEGEDANKEVQQVSEPNPQAVQILNQIAQLDKQIADAQKEFNNKIDQFKQNKIQLQQKLADLGVSSPTSESLKDNIVDVKAIKESYQDSKKKEEISSILYDAIWNADLSYTFTEKECDNYARYILEEMNTYSKNWNKKEDNWNNFWNILKKYRKIDSKYGSSEKDMNKLEESMKKSFKVKDNEYSWIFKD